MDDQTKFIAPRVLKKLPTLILSQGTNPILLQIKLNVISYMIY